MAKIPSVKWRKALMGKEKGGLGIGSLEDMNKALLAKWCWRYKTEQGALWIQIIDIIHGKYTCMEESRTVKSSFTWRQIVKQWNLLQSWELDPKTLIKKQIGNERSTFFWYDWWIGERPLKEEFQKLFHIDNNQRATVEDRIGINGGSWNWQGIIRDGRSKKELDKLMEKLSFVTLSETYDCCRCHGGPKGQFTVLG
ncbi:unnamed protein product [Lactuca virosa]|uniref:Reverse transcriptase zinc-binding domain-containing protein n=1 Tax=Lactuca virosa TaxID=75947 RepID=A0AAU9P9D2_9ASTR|nr:unnamed protein product [Lactuca virosa]